MENARMLNFRSFRFLAFASLSLALPLDSMAVSYGPAISPIWGSDSSSGGGRGLGRVNYMDTIGKQETLALSWLTTMTSPDALGMVKVKQKVKVAIRKANGPLVANLPTMLIVSQPFPDPCNTDNQAGQVNQTWYSNEWVNVFAYPGYCDEDIAEFYSDQGTLEAVIGNSGGERTLMFGLSVEGDYYNSMEDGEISVYKFLSYDADNHYRLCSITRLGEDANGWELITELSGVGPYLGGSDDVLRVASDKETATDGISKFRYQYYDIRSCELIQTKTATSPAF